MWNNPNALHVLLTMTTLLAPTTLASPASPPIDLVDAMWRGDDDYLHANAPCSCCCHEHTMRRCPARAWYGCRGQQAAIDAVDCDAEAWAASYARTRGMSRAAFYAYAGLEADAEQVA